MNETCRSNLFRGTLCQLHQACEGATLRGSRVISVEDILFLMRRDKVTKDFLSHALYYIYKLIFSPPSFLTFICFLIRHQRKLARLLKYLQFRDYKSKLLKNLDDDDTQQEPGTCINKHLEILKKSLEKPGKVLEFQAAVELTCFHRSHAAQVLLAAATSEGSDWLRTSWGGWITPVSSCHW